MSLTILVREGHAVSIVRWFFEKKGNIILATGPTIEMPFDEFRRTGFDFVHNHFKEYAKIRLSEKDVIPVFPNGEGAKLMKGRKAVEIGREPAGNFIFSPKRIAKYDLIYLEPVEREHRKTIPETSPPDVFWKTFDEALSAAPPDE